MPKSAMRDFRSQHIEALAHERGKPGPAFRRNHIAIDICLGGLHVDVDAADGRHFGLAGAEAGNLFTLQHAGHGHQDLNRPGFTGDRLA